jgi:hypothetical protein
MGVKRTRRVAPQMSAYDPQRTLGTIPMGRLSGFADRCPASSIRLRCVYYFFPAVVVIRYETTATAGWALPFIVRAFFDDTITVAVWTSFHVCAS